jgi:predicted small metal-binding protein
MSQTFEDLSRYLNVRCSDVGLDCNCVILGINEKKVIDATILHMFEYHAINPKEMTSEMKSKIRENIHLYLYRNSLRAQILHEVPDISEKLLPVV